LSREVRRADPGDAAAIQRLVERAYERYVPRIGLRPAPMDANYRELVARGEVWVIDGADGVPVGTIVLVAHLDHVLVENVAVVPELQGQGIGRALLDFAERHAREQGVGELRLYTHELMKENRHLYARLGYEETGREVRRSFARIFFRKRLRSERG
jgi:GNAT superfamily N-acetyltransferase